MPEIGPSPNPPRFGIPRSFDPATIVDPALTPLPNFGLSASPVPFSPGNGSWSPAQQAPQGSDGWPRTSIHESVNKQNRRNEALIRQFTPYVHRLADEARRAAPSPATPRQERKP